MEKTGNREQNQIQLNNRILEEAELIIREEGIDALSMRKLAKAADVSLMTPYNVFGSKVVLIQKLLAKHLGEVEQLLLENMTFTSVLAAHEMMDDVYKLIVKDEPFIRQLAWGYFSNINQSESDKDISAFTQLVAGWMQQKIDEGRFSEDAKALAMARHQVISMAGFAAIWLRGHISFEEQLVHQKYHICLSMLPYALGDDRQEIADAMHKIEALMLEKSGLADGGG